MRREQLIHLRFMDAMLDQYGTFSRRMMMDVFEISSANASRSIQLYKTYQPSMYLDHVSKDYMAYNDFATNINIWNNKMTVAQFLRGIELVYDVKIGIQQVPTLGVHR